MVVWLEVGKATWLRHQSMLVDNYIVGKCKTGLNQANLVKGKNIKTYEREGFSWQESKSGHLCLPPTHPTKNSQGIRREGFKSEDRHMRPLPCPFIQQSTLKVRKENTPQGNTQAHTPAGTHTPGQEAEEQPQRGVGNIICRAHPFG
jgi:hypothetical protein